MAIKPVLPKTQYELITGKKKDFNRGKITSRKTDDVKDFTIGIRDLDFAIKYYFKNVIKPQSVENNTIIDVPIIYGSPERWKSIQRDGYFKDQKDKIVLPIIIYKRISISKDESIAIDKLDANNPILFYQFKKKWSEKNKYDNFAASIGIIPTQEFYSVVIPDYVKMSYDFIIMTEAVEQMNKIVEAVIYSEGAYWGEKERFKFRTKIETYNTNIESSADNVRTVKTTFSLELNGYLIPDSINKQLPLMAGNFEKAFSTKQVFFGTDVDTQLTGTGETTTSTAGISPSVTSIQGGTVSVASSNVIDYLGLTINKVANSVTTTTATFNNVNIKQAPDGSGLTTTKENFYIFINGQYTSNANIVSVADSGTTVVVTFTGLAFSIDSNDSIVGIGKFLEL